MQNTARNSTFVVLVVAVIITISIIVRAADWATLLLIPVLLGFSAWAMVPYLVLFFSARLPTSSKVSWVVFCATLVIVCMGVFIYIDAFFVHLDPQSGLVFIFVPLYQLILAGIMFAIALFSSRSI